MTKLCELAPLFEMTAAELRQRRFDELLASRINPFSVREMSQEDAKQADERAKRYDEAAKRTSCGSPAFCSLVRSARDRKREPAIAERRLPPAPSQRHARAGGHPRHVETTGALPEASSE